MPRSKLERDIKLVDPDSRNGQLTDASSIDLVPGIGQPPHGCFRLRCRIALTKLWRPQGRIIRRYCSLGNPLVP
jgi:hypothetical protein